ncbi:MAG: glycoside hydrolase family 57 protein [Campylobacterota bacterium]
MSEKKLKLAFLWHMHQPYYKDDKSDKTLFPWVFLHSIKDYYDIPWYGSLFPNLKTTFNLVPSLVRQIESYIDNSANDKLLETLKKDIVNLTTHDKEYLQSYLFLSNEKNMIKPLKRYYELYLKYNTHKTIQDFSSSELLDTQVLFLLSWCGVYLRTSNEEVKFLLAKGDNFSQEEKIKLINELVAFLPSIIQLYKKLDSENKITVCTTPYFHPITPLLLDFSNAKKAKHDVVMPEKLASFKEFGIKNTEDAIQFFENRFGKKTKGFWPAEGSVSQDTAELFTKNGLQWFCSDEETLFKSPNKREKKDIYKNYQLQTQNGVIDVRFRDHYLSDLIGFEYSNIEPKVAAKRFVEHLQEIYNSCDFMPLVNVILDGENAWEFFPNNAFEFFNELYSLFESTSWIETVTMDEVTHDKQIVCETLSHIHSGSWINGNFDIWIGSKQKNRAWELLSITKRDFDKYKNSLDKKTLQLIENEFMVALASDWFWWYGDDHFTVQSKEFDTFFRTHLINIYEYLKLPTPLEILRPIVDDTSNNGFHTKPLSFIYQNLACDKSNYFEWINSGFIDIKKEFSVMDSSKNIVKNIKYGYNVGKFYLFFDGNFAKLFKKISLIVTLNDKEFEIFVTKGKQNIIQEDISCNVFSLENSIQIEFSSKQLTVGKKIDFKFSIFEGANKVQSFPLYNSFIIDIENLDLKNWYI